MKKFKLILIFSGLILAAVVLGIWTFLYIQRGIKYKVPNLVREERMEDLAWILKKYPSWSKRLDKEGRNGLHYATDTRTAELLIKSGADVNQADIYGFTPLHTVSNPAVVKLLLQNGGDVSMTSYGTRYTPLHCTVNYTTLEGNESIQDAPIEKFEFPKPPIADAVEKVKILLKFGANVNAEASNQETPLDITSTKELQDILIANGGKTNTKGWWKKKLDPNRPKSNPFK